MFNVHMNLQVSAKVNVVSYVFALSIFPIITFTIFAILCDTLQPSITSEIRHNILRISYVSHTVPFVGHPDIPAHPFIQSFGHNNITQETTDITTTPMDYCSLQLHLQRNMCMDAVGSPCGPPKKPTKCNLLELRPTQRQFRPQTLQTVTVALAITHTTVFFSITIT